MAVSWPLVGRDSELQELAAAVEDPQCSAVIVAGPRGVGKSRLLQEVLLRARTSGAAVLWVNGMAATTAVSFGPLLHLLPDEEPLRGSPADVSRRLLSEVSRRSSKHRLGVVAIDDAHLLDDASAAIVYEMATHRDTFVLLTVVSGERLPRPLAALLGEGHARPLALAPLLRTEADALLLRVLGGAVDRDTGGALWDLSRGNPRVLHDVVCGGLAEGNLTEDHEGWRWGEPRSLIPSFDAVIESVFRLSPDERVVVELLAISDPLEALVLERLTVPSAVLALERRGLIEVTTDRHRVAARMSGSISADLVRAATPPLAARALRRSLADVLTSVGGRRRGDLPRLVSMRLDAGEAPDVEDLMNAAEKVLELFDPAVGERLARRAVEAEAGPRATRLLALALFDLGRGDEVEALLVATDQEARSEEDIVATALIRAQNLFFRLQQPAAAFEVLAKADADLTSEARHRRLGALRGELLMWSDSITRVIDDVERQQPVDGPQAAPWRLSMSALARAYSGQPELALASLDDADDPWANAVSRQWSRWWALWLSGRIREAHTTAESFYAAAGDDEIARRYPASWPMMLGYALLLRGRPLSAGRFLREAISLGTDRAGFRHLCLTLLAQSYALTGETTEARTALARAGELHNPSLRSHQYELSLAEAWVAASEGRVDLAVERALAAAQAARTLGQRPFEALALHATARLGRPLLVTDRLEELALHVDGRLAKVLAAHARPFARHDGPALLAAARELHYMGASLDAAEAAGEASACLHGQGKEAEAYASHLFARALAAECQGARTPGLARLQDELDPLTTREREVAELAGTGRTAGEIAAQLTISTRTANNHLYRIYRKLKISSRAELTSLQSQSTSWLEPVDEPQGEGPYTQGIPTGDLSTQ